MTCDEYEDAMFSIYEDLNRYDKDDKPCQGCHKYEDAIDDVADCFTELVRHLYSETDEVNIYTIDRILWNMKSLLSEHVINLSMPDRAPTLKRNFYQGEAA